MDATETRILEAAGALLAEGGFRGMTTKAIAQRAGVNEVTVFRRFGNKVGLAKALGASWSQQMAGFAVDAAHDPLDTRATLKWLAQLEMEQARTHGAAAMRLAMDARGVPQLAEAMGQGSAANFQGLVDYLHDAVSRGDLRDDVPVEVMAEMFFATTSSLVMSRQLMGAQPVRSGDVDRLADQVFAVFWAGVTARKEGS